MIDTEANSSFLTKQSCELAGLNCKKLKQNEFTLSGARGEMLLIITEYVETEIEFGGDLDYEKIILENCRFYILPEEFPTNMIIGNDIVVSLRRANIDLLNFVNQNIPSTNNYFYNYEEVEIPMFSAFLVDCYIPNIKTNDHLILYPFCDKNIKVEIPECVVKSNNIKVLIMNNTSNYISLEKGKPLGVFEYAKEPLKITKISDFYAM